MEKLKHLRIAALLMGILLGVSVQAQECALKYNGLYMSKSEEDPEDYLFKYLRFYEDGTVISVLSEDTVNQIAQWFHKDVDDVSIGEYKLKKCEVKFKTDNTAGKFGYSGMVNGSVLELQKKHPGIPQPQPLNYKFISVAVKQ